MMATAFVRNVYTALAGAARRSVLRVAVLSTLTLMFGLAGSASAIPLGYTCIGNCGTLGADGVVTTPPSAATYDWVSTSGGVSLGSMDLNLGGETNGSILRSGVFSANALDALEFDFDFVTSDGAGFADYVWARLVDATFVPVPGGLLFTGRTAASGDIVPGFGMPGLNSTLTPATTPIIPGAPSWTPLGGSTGTCWAAGCGYTGWIHSSYVIPGAGNYVLEFGAVNWSDTAFNTGLALAGATVADVPIDGSSQVPEPGTMLLLATGLAATVRKVRSRRRQA